MYRCQRDGISELHTVGLFISPRCRPLSARNRRDVPQKFIQEPSTVSNQTPWCGVLTAALLPFKVLRDVTLCCWGHWLLAFPRNTGPSCPRAEQPKKSPFSLLPPKPVPPKRSLLLIFSG